MSPIVTTSLVGVALLVGLVAYRPLKKWVKKVKRRKGGVYGYRTRRHDNAFRREWGYIGETVSFYFRDRQHLSGQSHFAAAGGKRLAKPTSGPAQPWSDLDPVLIKIIKLPWWLCWKWVLRPLETLVILCTWPRYNDAKNHWNPRRVTKSMAKAQRAARDSHTVIQRVGVTVVSWSRRLTMAAGAGVVVIGLAGWMITR
jgi:hypothetical protein